MHVGLLIIDCFLGNSMSLKDKRRILSSITERLRRSFNIALCEIDYQDQWQRSKIAVVLVNTEWRVIQQSQSKIVNLIEKDRRINVLNANIERLL